MSIELIIATITIVVISIFAEVRVSIAEDNVKIMDRREEACRSKILEMSNLGREFLFDYVIMQKILEEQFGKDVEEMYILKKIELKYSGKSLDDYIEEIAKFKCEEDMG